MSKLEWTTEQLLNEVVGTFSQGLRMPPNNQNALRLYEERVEWLIEKQPANASANLKALKVQCLKTEAAIRQAVDGRAKEAARILAERIAGLHK